MEREGTTKYRGGVGWWADGLCGTLMGGVFGGKMGFIVWVVFLRFRERRG